MEDNRLNLLDQVDEKFMIWLEDAASVPWTRPLSVSLNSTRGISDTAQRTSLSSKVDELTMDKKKPSLMVIQKWFAALSKHNLFSKIN